MGEATMGGVHPRSQVGDGNLGLSSLRILSAFLLLCLACCPGPDLWVFRYREI